MSDFPGVEFDWNLDHLSEKPFVKSLDPEIIQEWVIEAIGSMKNRKTASPFQIVPEMLKVSGEAGVIFIDFREFTLARRKVSSSVSPKEKVMLSGKYRS